MKILQTKVLKGPNYWSNYRKKLIEIKLDLGRFEDLPSNLIAGFNERLLALLPGLRKDHCSEGSAGGFVKRLQDGTWLGHVMEHVALELQTQAGMECGYGRTRSTATRGVYHVVFAYEVEEAGKYAGLAALRLVSSLANGYNYHVGDDIKTLRNIAEQNQLEPFAQALASVAGQRNIPFLYDKINGKVLLGNGIHQKAFETKELGNDLIHPRYPDDSFVDQANHFLEKIFPPHKATRIPIIAVTGTNGKQQPRA